jgi:hypothetical protein
MRLSILLVALVAGAFEAAADPAPREFYERNFAEAPEVAHEPLAGEVLSGKRDSAHAANTGSTISSSDVDGTKVSKRVVEDHTQQQVAEDNRPFPSSVISVYVNSKDAVHVKRVLIKALEVARKGDVSLSAIFHIGDYRNIPAELAEELAAGGAAIYPLAQVPANLPISNSPAWIFQGRDGYRIVEGTLDVEQFYDSSGKFSEPQTFIDTSKVQATPETEKLAGF